MFILAVSSWRRLLLRAPLIVGCAALAWACRERETVALRAAPAAERWSFVLPSGYEKVQLRGEGSETLSAPSGAHVERSTLGFRVEAGPDFVIEIVPDAPGLAALEPAGVSRVLAESDAHVFQAPAGGYSFIVVRDLVPEWDEGARQRFACRSAGGSVSGGGTGAAERRFSKSAIEAMVAACRTLELPALE